MSEVIHRKKQLSSFKLIVIGFAGVIVLGALILMLPFSSTTSGSVTGTVTEKTSVISQWA